MTFTAVLLMLLAILVGVLFGTLASGYDRANRYDRQRERERREYDDYFRSIEDD